MKKVVGVTISLFILMGVSIGGYSWLVNKQIKNVESYLVKTGMRWKRYLSRRIHSILF